MNKSNTNRFPRIQQLFHLLGMLGIAVACVPDDGAVGNSGGTSEDYDSSPSRGQTEDAPWFDACEMRSGTNESPKTIAATWEKRDGWSVRRLAVNDAHLYWLSIVSGTKYGEPADFEIYRAPLNSAGGEGELIASETAPDDFIDFAVDNDFIFVGSGEVLMRFDPQGVLLDATNMGFPVHFDHNDQDAENLYLLTYDDRVVAVEKATANPSVLAEDLGDTESLAIDEDNIYVTRDTGERVQRPDINDPWEVIEVFSLSKSGGPEVSLGKAYTSDVTAAALHSTTDYLYLSTYSKKMARISKAGAGMEWVLPDETCEENTGWSIQPSSHVYPGVSGVFTFTRNSDQFLFVSNDATVSAPIVPARDWNSGVAVSEGSTLYYKRDQDGAEGAIIALNID